ncbi:hypothetical protein D3C86_2111740 [compost metagenome]
MGCVYSARLNLGSALKANPRIFMAVSAIIGALPGIKPTADVVIPNKLKVLFNSSRFSATFRFV